MIKIISKIGYQKIISFSFNLAAPKPKTIQLKMYLKPITLDTIIQLYWKDSKIIAKMRQNNCEIKYKFNCILSKSL
jgi:hypothetical protein